MVCGIYLLSFKGTDSVYIGKSKNIEKRFNEHLSSLKNNTASKKMQDAYIKFGLPELHILKIADEDTIDKLEIEYIKEFDAVKNGLNSSSFCNSGGSYGDNCSSSIYSNETYIEIFNELLKNYTDSYATIASKFSVSKELVSGIASGSRGQILLNELFPEEYKKLMQMKGTRQSRKDTPQTTSSHDEDKYIEAIKLLTSDAKYTHSLISSITGISISVIRDISSCRRHKWLAIKCPHEWNILLNKSIKRNK